MDFSTILPFVAAILQSAAAWKTAAPPPPTPAEVPAGTIPHPSQAIKDLQTFLNAALRLSPKLDVDGWLGPKTEKAIEEGIAMLKSVGIG